LIPEVPFTIIGIVRSPWKTTEGMPVQPVGAKDVQGRIDIFEEFRPGLIDLAGFSRIILIYQFHDSKGYDLMVVPFLDTKTHGVFATRAPRRPSQIGLSIVRLLEVDESGIEIADIDILDGTPVLDIKPYIPDIDSYPGEKTGWLSEPGAMAVSRADRRFTDRE
jgi:tRNA-Thr(GGU) m(6)t(6)A37 methyltransferase TsaA